MGLVPGREAAASWPPLSCCSGACRETTAARRPGEDPTAPQMCRRLALGRLAPRAEM